MKDLGICEWCHDRPAVEKHHMLVHRMKGVPELNNERNLLKVCRRCHESGQVNSYFSRCYFWACQCDKYGYEDMMNWYSSLPLKIKEKFWHV